MIRYIHIRPYQRGLVFRQEEPIRVLHPGHHILLNLTRQVRVHVFDVREPYLPPQDLEAIVKSGVLGDELEAVNLGRQERAFVWLDGRLDRVLEPGLHAILTPYFDVRVDRVSVLDVFLVDETVENSIFRSKDLEEIAESGLVDGEAQTLDIGDGQRALVWVDGRFRRILAPGLHVLWTVRDNVRVEVVEVGDGRFRHDEAEAVLASVGNTGDAYLAADLEAVYVGEDHTGLLFRDGAFEAELEPGVHGLWSDAAIFVVNQVDLREQMLDIQGQDVMTADKVTLRVNAVVTYRVADARRAEEAAEDVSRALYREGQLALRSVIGTRELDPLLAEKDAVTSELEEAVRDKAGDLGLHLVSLGLRDLVLPGEMRTLLNRVTEARKAAEAEQISRREETAAMRSQANTARIFESNPTLMKLRELEVLEKVSEHGRLEVVLGEGGIAERLTKMI